MSELKWAGDPYVDKPHLVCLKDNISGKEYLVHVFHGIIVEKIKLGSISIEEAKKKMITC